MITARLKSISFSGVNFSLSLIIVLEAAHIRKKVNNY